MVDAEYALKGRISMFSPFLSGNQNRSDEEVAEWERQQAKLGQDYGSPWLSGLVTFSGFVAAFIGSIAVLFVIANLRHGRVWLPYAVILAALVGTHLCLRAVRYRRRRHARQSAVGDHGQVTRDRTPNRRTEQ
jgi:Flp pilus assembly protein TadB